MLAHRMCLHIRKNRAANKQQSLAIIESRLDGRWDACSMRAPTGIGLVRVLLLLLLFQWPFGFGHAREIIYDFLC